MRCRSLSQFILIAGLLWPSLATPGNNYRALLDAAVKDCTAINPEDYQTGLLFNPNGYRSYYQQSACFQNAAIRFRAANLCTRVKQRRALFSSSWGYSKGNCLEMVVEGVASDVQSIAEQREHYQSGHVQLDTFTIERNGNGRDFDIVPSFSGDKAHAYILHFELIPDRADGMPILLDKSSFYLQGNADRIHIYLKATELQERFPDFVSGRTYTVRATLTYSIGTGTQAGYWTDSFIEHQFPLGQRTQVLTRKIRFQNAPPGRKTAYSGCPLTRPEDRCVEKEY